MKEPFTHVDRSWPLPDPAEEVMEPEEATENEEGAERPPAFSPLFLKLIGSYEK